MNVLPFDIQPRVASRRSAAKKLRKEGRIPGVVYGGKMTPTPISVDGKLFLAAIKGEFGHNVVFEIEIEGEKKLCMMKDFQFDSVKRVLTHVDLYVIKEDQKVTLTVPVATTGESIGVKAGGVLKILKRDVKLSCKVRFIPRAVVQDVVELDITDSIYIDELTVPEHCSFVYNNRFPVIRIAKKRGILEEEGGEETEETEGTEETETSS